MEGIIVSGHKAGGKYAAEHEKRNACYNNVG